MTVTCTKVDAPVDLDYIKHHHLFPGGWASTHVHHDPENPGVLTYCTGRLHGAL